MTSGVKALAFDVFGTVVDWRGSIIKMGPAFSAAHGFELDWAAFADAWRAEYQPSMERVRSGEIGFVKLDILHRVNLEKVLNDFGVGGLSEAALDDFNRMWHRLDPWPDVVSGLTRLKTKYILVTLSNGNVSLMVDMAKRAGLPWDTILGAEIAGNYKPAPDVYRNAADILDLAPGEVMMVAAHNGDLIAASGVGLRTAFVVRPTEYGSGQSTDQSAERDYDVVATDFVDLAAQLQT
ncbi:MAG: haloacid dehalogenase type II [Alphaproteobacteria bacterium]|nr:haloacid dehalogenase type II [Alphaproteobacteria bacterium]